MTRSQPPRCSASAIASRVSTRSTVASNPPRRSSRETSVASSSESSTSKTCRGRVMAALAIIAAGPHACNASYSFARRPWSRTPALGSPRALLPEVDRVGTPRVAGRLLLGELEPVEHAADALGDLAVGHRRRVVLPGAHAAVVRDDELE